MVLRFLQKTIALALLVGPQTASQVPRFSTGSNLVVLSATAVDKHGRPVSGLTAKDFRVLEDGGPLRAGPRSIGTDPASCGRQR